MNDEPRKDTPLSDEERARALREQLKQVHAFDLAFEMAVSLVSFGYQKLGLTAETRELRDLADARLAIELLRAELDVLSRELGDARLGDLRATLAHLQMSYAQAVGAAEPQPPAAAQAGSESPADEDGAPVTQKEQPSEKKQPARKKPAPAKAAASKQAAAAKKAAASKKAAAGKEAGGAARAARRKGSAGAKDEPAT
jgi:hypothetical protein